MKIKSVEFIISAVKPDQYPTDPIPEIALVGRSNVGKSSLINRLLNRKNVARVSAKPGKTQTINFFLINEAFHLVDLPGYGYAQVSKTQREAWGKMMERYLTGRDKLQAVVQLVDIRHPPSKDDIQMHEWLLYYRIPTVVIATKADKISRGNWPKHMKVIRETLKLGKDVPILMFSSESGLGKDEAWALFESILFPVVDEVDTTQSISPDSEAVSPSVAENGHSRE
jgi:GTP-binding protein